MTPKDYTTHALRTTRDRNPIRLALEVAAEAGEVAGVACKAMRQGAQPDPDRIVDECGDVLWSVAVLLDAVGSSLEQAMHRNVAKLQTRYGLAEVVADAEFVADRPSELTAAAQRYRDARQATIDTSNQLLRLAVYGSAGARNAARCARDAAVMDEDAAREALLTLCGVDVTR